MAEINRENFARLKPALLLDDQAFDNGALGQAPSVMLLEHAEVDKNVALGLIAHQKAETTRGIEPFHRARQLD